MSEPVFQLIESFASIQGESSFAGLPCFFLRFARCNLACSYCDTAYAQTEAGRTADAEELLALVRAGGLELVELTGGEPLLQPGLPLLARRLIDAGFTVLVETNGSLPVEALPPGVHRILDCKPPSSGMAGHNLESNYRCLTRRDEVKFPVADRADFDYARAVIERHRLCDKVDYLHFSPIHGVLPAAELAAWLIAARIPGARLHLQLHKFVWDPEARGV